MTKRGIDSRSTVIIVSPALTVQNQFAVPIWMRPKIQSSCWVEFAAGMITEICVSTSDLFFFFSFDPSEPEISLQFIVPFHRTFALTTGSCFDVDVQHYGDGLIAIFKPPYLPQPLMICNSLPDVCISFSCTSRSSQRLIAPFSTTYVAWETFDYAHSICVRVYGCYNPSDRFE
jgi:hypothetical protein